MTFALYVDGPRWRRHTESVRDSVGAAVAPAGELIPVIKGNGYGFGNARLAREAARLGSSTVAVGTIDEVAEVAEQSDREDVLVLAPYDPRDAQAAKSWAAALDGPHRTRLVATISTPDGLTNAARTESAPRRVLIESLTSLHRFGLNDDELTNTLRDDAVRHAIRDQRLRIEGLALHLPLSQPDARRSPTTETMLHDARVAVATSGTARTQETVTFAHRWLTVAGDFADSTGLSSAATERLLTMWVSHLDDHELTAVRAAVPGLGLNARIGSRLWLGDRDALTARGTVLAVHRVSKGDRVGYRQRRAPRDGVLVIVGGGTAHGVALEAPSPVITARQRAIAAATGALEAIGRAKSPFMVNGQQRWFAEPPHMQVSLLWLGSADGAAPRVGDEVSADVRLTTAHFDHVVGLD
jgi:alanine racemase